MKKVLIFLSFLLLSSQAEARFYPAIKNLDRSGVGVSEDITVAAEDNALWKYDLASASWGLEQDATGAPTAATYITQTAHADLSAEQALSTLSSGIMRVATTTGVITSLTDSAGIAANISDEIGTGVLVFGTAPTFTTSITTPLVIGGTATTSDLSLQTTSGVGATGADMHFLVGNNGATEAMTILNNGNVGIGTTTPGAKLDFGTLAGSPAVYLYNGGAASRLGMGIQSSEFQFFNAVGNHYSFNFGGDLQTSGTNEVIRILSTGNVGIGTTGPTDLLHVYKSYVSNDVTSRIENASNTAGAGAALLLDVGGTSAGDPRIIFTGGNDTFAIGSDTSDSGKFKISDSSGLGTNDRLTIDSTGNVGIGTVSPTNLLSLGGNSARIFWMERHTTANTAGNNLTVEAGGATSAATNKAGGDLVLKSGTATGTGTSKITFQTHPAGSTGTTDTTATTAMTILGSGNVGIKTASPGNQALTIAGSATDGYGGLRVTGSSLNNNQAASIDLEDTRATVGVLYTLMSRGGNFEIQERTLDSAGIGTIRFTIDTDGNAFFPVKMRVGDTTAPTEAFEVAGDGLFTGNLSVGSAAGTTNDFEVNGNASTTVMFDSGASGFTTVNFQAGGSQSPTWVTEYENSSGTVIQGRDAELRLQQASGAVNPTISACGTTPSVVGGDQAGKVTAGTGAVTSCTITFAVAYDLAPVCIVQNHTTEQTLLPSTSTTALTVTSATDFASDVLAYFCFGHSETA